MRITGLPKKCSVVNIFERERERKKAEIEKK
jgi:hypothetical protein